MLSWLVDHAGFVYLVLGIAALMLGALWWMNRKRGYLIGLAVVAVLFALVLLIGRVVVTDRQQIERALRAMADGVVDGKPDQVFKHLAKTFRFDGMDRATFIGHADRAIRQHRVKDLYLWQIQPEDLNPGAGKARFSFNIRVASDWTDNTQLFLVRAEFVREDGQWRMQGFQIFNPVVNTDTPIHVPLP